MQSRGSRLSRPSSAPHTPPPGPPHTRQPLGSSQGHLPQAYPCRRGPSGPHEHLPRSQGSLREHLLAPFGSSLERLGLPFHNFTSNYIRTRKYTVRNGAGPTPFLEQGGAQGPFLYLLGTLRLALTIERDYPAYAPYPLLSPLVGFADDTNITVAHTPHEPHRPDNGPTVTQHANDLLSVTISYLSHNNLIVYPTTSVAMMKVSATTPTLGPQGPPMNVVEATKHLEVMQTTKCNNTTVPSKLQSHLVHLPGYASPGTKALSLFLQSLLYSFTGVLNASMGF